MRGVNSMTILACEGLEEIIISLLWQTLQCYANANAQMDQFHFASYTCLHMLNIKPHFWPNYSILFYFNSYAQEDESC